MSAQATQRGRISRRAALRVSGGAGLGLAVGALARSTRPTHAGQAALRWDIVSLQPQAGSPNLYPGGEASARTISGEQITVTGTGTFTPDVPQAVTGGGTYVIQTPSGDVVSKGTYQVTHLLFWQDAPGTLPDAVIDHIGANADARSGLVGLRITLSDGNDGVLVVSCHLPVDSPAPVFEGIIAAHRFAFFYNNEPPQDDVDANRTVFHIIA